MGTKRSRHEHENSTPEGNRIGMGHTLSYLNGSKNKASEKTDHDASSSKFPSTESPEKHEDEWKKVENRGMKKRKLNPDKAKNNYPEITHTHHARLQSKVKVTDFQNLALYILANGTAPQWVSVRHHYSIRKVVVLMVPGLDPEMFDGTTLLKNAATKATVENDKAAVQSDTAEAEAGSNSDRKTKVVVPQNPRKFTPEDYYPVKLQAAKLPEALKPLAEIFSHIWPLKTPGDDKFFRIHSPLQAMLTVPLVKSKEEKKMKGPIPAKSDHWQNKRTVITEYLCTVDDLQENDYVLHPAFYTTEAAKHESQAVRERSKQSAKEGWVDTRVTNLNDGNVPDKDIQKGSLTAGRKVVAIDCEMCKTEGGAFELTRISLVDWDGNEILDELVKPETPIMDYLTQYSGITQEMLEPIKTTLADIQKRLLDIITPTTILIGHSLNADLIALKLTHPFIVDTSVIYPHPRGPPLKSSLKWLTQKYVGREIQKQHGATGHDSVEDARAVLDLVKQKCEKGPQWGSSEASSESIFKRLKRATRPKPFRVDQNEEEFRTTAIVDWGSPQRGHGTHADIIIGCGNDREVTEGIKRVVVGDKDGDMASRMGVDFVWGRFRELEAIRGWWSASKTVDNDELRREALSRYSVSEAQAEGDGPDVTVLADAVSQVIGHITDIYTSLPPCTALLVYSGHGDPRETFRLQDMHQQYKREFQTKKWDELTVRWTDDENQLLRKACNRAREGVGFVVVK
jgi:RNA exonuclease 1